MFYIVFKAPNSVAEESEESQSKMIFYWHVAGRIIALLLIVIHLAIAAGFLNTAYKQLHDRALKTLRDNIDYSSLRAEVRIYELTFDCL